jgi:coatomer protein complex subunit epsilon
LFIFFYIKYSLALQAQMLVQMNRGDKAMQVLSKMQQIDDDSTLTELVKGWVCTGQGQDKQEQALYAFEELGAKFGRTVLILNNIAACHIVLGNYNEADRCLDEAFEDGKSSAETYINAIVSAQLQDKGKDVINDLIDKLKLIDSNHPWLLENGKKENEFNEASKQFS